MSHFFIHVCSSVETILWSRGNILELTDSFIPHHLAILETQSTNAKETSQDCDLEAKRRAIEQAKEEASFQH